MHWRKNHDSEAARLLKSVDLYDAAKSEPNRPVYLSPIVEIERMTVEAIKSREKPKGERRNFAYFKGKQKPLGLNVGACEQLEAFAGSPDPKHWVGLVIQLYVDPQAKYPSGKKGPAIRIRPTLPKGAKPDTSPLPEVPEADRDRLEAEHADRIAEPAEQEGQ